MVGWVSWVRLQALHRCVDCRGPAVITLAVVLTYLGSRVLLLSLCAPQLAKHRGVKTINVVRRAEQAAELLALG